MILPNSCIIKQIKSNVALGYFSSSECIVTNLILATTCLLWWLFVRIGLFYFSKPVWILICNTVIHHFYVILWVYNVKIQTGCFTSILNRNDTTWNGTTHCLKYVSNAIYLLFQYNKHLFVHIGQTNHSYSDALLESVDIRQIYDKFPEKKGGLKELYGKGPQNSFFLIKFWVSVICQPHC